MGKKDLSGSKEILLLEILLRRYTGLISDPRAVF
jgi:hypothetical protein